MKIGYCRISTGDQNLNLQKDALTKAGCSKIFEDVASGAVDTRPGLIEALNFARKDDCIIIWKLDRLGRSLKNLIEIITDLEKRGIALQSLTEGLDTSSAAGKLQMNIFASLAQFERELIVERTKAGLASARARGRMGGRPKKLDKKKLELAQALLKDKNLPIKNICETLGVSRTTLYRNCPAQSFGHAVSLCSK